MSKFNSFEEIESWKRARVIVRNINSITGQGDFFRDFALKDQVRRSASSIMVNIAEGFEREGNREFINFLSYAKGSCAETRSHLYIALDNDYLSEEEFEDLNDELKQIGRLIGGLMSYLRKSGIRGSKFKN